MKNNFTSPFQIAILIPSTKESQMTKQEFLKKYNLTEGQFGGTEKIDGDLDLNSLEAIPIGFNPTVGGSLYLRSLKEIPEGFNPTVGGHLYLHSLKKVPKGFNPTVGRHLYLNSLKEIPEGFNPTVGGTLCLNSLNKIPKGFNPTVGGHLWLSFLKKIPDGFNPTVGGDLGLSSIEVIPEGFNPTVGGVYPPAIPHAKHGGHFIKDGFIFCDGILSRIVSSKGNVHKITHIAKDEISYIVHSDGKFAHGATIKEARESLMFKISDRDKSRFEHLKLDSKLKLAEMIECYRVVTGACEAGVRHFLSTIKTKKSYTIKEVIDLTKGQFGHQDFKEFFQPL
jgi:hypothetical protein